MNSIFATLQKWAAFVRFSHTVFALPFALAAMAVAARDNHGWPGWRTFGLILAAMVCARTCAMAFNRIVDRKFDALNPRTAGRHLPTGQISLSSAVTCLCVWPARAWSAASYLLNPLCFYLSPVALVVICFYSLTKRFTDYTHVYLGLALALAPVGAWLAVKGTNVSVPGKSSRWSCWPWWWCSGSSGSTSSTRCRITNSTARMGCTRWSSPGGRRTPCKPPSWRTCSCADSCSLFGLLCKFRIAYLVGWLLIVGCLVLEHWIARRRSLNWINVAFFRLNAVVSAIFLVVTLAEVVFRAASGCADICQTRPFC